MLGGRGGLVIAGTKGQRACEFTNGGILLGCGLAPWGNKGHRRPQIPLTLGSGSGGTTPKLCRIVRKYPSRLDISVGQ